MMVKMLCEIDKSYKRKKLYTKDNQRNFLCGKLVKAVYGIILYAILFYNNLSAQLKNWWFENNPYDKWTYNKTVGGE